MNPDKIDPYATKVHSRINVLLLLFTILVIALVLRASGAWADDKNQKRGGQRRSVGRGGGGLFSHNFNSR